MSSGAEFGTTESMATSASSAILTQTSMSEAPAAASDDPLSRAALQTAELHPLSLDGLDSGGVTTTSPSLGRPLWAHRAEAQAVNSGPSRYFDLKSLQEKLEISHQSATASPLHSRNEYDGHESDASSTHGMGAGTSTDGETEDDLNASAERSKMRQGHYDSQEESNAELAAVFASPGEDSLAPSRRRPPPLVAPQPRTPLGFPVNSRSASQTPQAAASRQARASSRASQRQGALSPFGLAAQLEGRQITRPTSAFKGPDDADGDGHAVPGVDVMAELHTMSDAELARLLGTITADNRPLHTPAGKGSPLVRRRADSSTSALDHAPSTPKAGGGAAASSLASLRAQSQTHALIRSMSHALSEALEDAAKAKTSAIKERAKNQEAVEYMNQHHHARESALKDLCLQHGIKEGEISRCLLRAPVFDAEATKKRIETQGQVLTTPKTVAADLAGYRDGAESGDASEEASANLPQSLQEAMLEDLDGAFGTSVGDASPSMSTISHTAGTRSPERSPSATSFRTDASASTFSRLRRADGKMRGSHADLRTDITSIAATSRSPVTITSPGKPNKLARPQAVRSSSSASMTARTASATTSGLGEWASGLMPWAASGASRKAAASTASSDIKATSPGRHTISEGVGGDAPDPFDTPTKSKSTTALPDEAAKSADSPGSPSAKSAASSDLQPQAARSGLAIFGTLAWRRKKPQSGTQGRTAGVSEETSVPGHAAETSSDTVKARSGELNASAASTDTAKSASVDATGRDGGEHDEESTGIERPIAIRRSSSKSMPVALHEAIGSDPTTPLTEKLQAQLGLPSGALPKPTHFKAIFLATRIMTPDSSSLLLDSGRKTSALIASLAMSLVGRARDEGKVVDEPTRSGSARRVSGSAARPVSVAHAMLTQTVEEQAKRAPVSPAASGPKSASATTFARAFGRYTRSPSKESAGNPIEPNVTRLPDTYRFTAANAPAPSGPGSAEDSSVKDSLLGLPRPPAAAVELEAIVPSEHAPPTLIKKRNKKRTRSKATSLGPSRVAAAVSRPGRLDPLDEESSGDEFEVYGGKGPATGYGKVDSFVGADNDDDRDEDSDTDGDAELLTDRYGFIYDATPADIRLLRQARKASTPAPACLTGIRVGVRARGGTDSQSEEEKDDQGLTELDTEDERTDAESSSPVDEAADEANEGASEADSLATTGDTSAPSEGGESGASSKRRKARGLLSLSHSKPVAEALSVSVTSQPSATRRRDRQTTATANSGASTSTTANASVMAASEGSPPRSPVAGRSRASSAGRDPRPSKPTTSQTVKRLLGQLQEMHETQQTTHKAKWDEFLQRRRERLSRASAEGANGQVSGANATSHTRRNSASSQQKLGIAALASSEKAPEEDWSQGMVGINRMGASKSGKEDWKHFLSLCQAGIPLCYRAKIWAECSGANEVHEPGRYQELLNEHEGETNQCLTQIDLDVHRTMPTNVFFGGDGQGVPKLRRLLVAFSWYNPACGYCQGMNNLAATLLLTHATEEEAFWVLVCIIEKILPSEYYTSHLLVSQADQRVLIELVDELMPSLSAHIAELGVDLPAVTFAWFLSLYTDCLPVETLFRVWDVMFVEGMVILFRVAIAILKMNEADLLATNSAAAFYGQVHSMTSRLFSVDRLIKLACDELKLSIRYAVILEKRERHVADLTRELGLDA